MSWSLVAPREVPVEGGVPVPGKKTVNKNNSAVRDKEKKKRSRASTSGAGATASKKRSKTNKDPPRA